MNHNNKIAIIGPYPPPLGGISIHIQRTISLLDEREFIFFNESKASSQLNNEVNASGYRRLIPLLYIAFFSYRVIHAHSPNKYFRLFLCILAIFKDGIYIHVHGASIRNTLEDRYSITSFLIKKLLKHVNILADNQDIINAVAPYKPLSVSEIDAFLPPHFCIKIYDDFIQQIKKPEAEFLISTIGWFTEYKSEDLYGYDILLDTLQILREKNKINVKILASVNGIHDQHIYKRFITKRKAHNLEDSFILLTENYKEIWPLYLITDLFIRATNTDGSALSIKEALWFESTVITSDCVPRPKECFLFNNRSSKDLALKIIHHLDEKKLPLEEKINKIEQKVFKYNLFKEIYNV